MAFWLVDLLLTQDYKHLSGSVHKKLLIRQEQRLGRMVRSSLCLVASSKATLPTCPDLLPWSVLETWGSSPSDQSEQDSSKQDQQPDIERLA